MKLYSISIILVMILPVFLVFKSSGNLQDQFKGEPSDMGFFQQEKKDKGVGPIKNIELGPIDQKMVSKGKDLFNNKCLVCHDLDQKKVGPPLRNITKTRTPEYIMNLLVNTVQMQQEDAIIKELISIYKITMTPPDFSNEQARSVLEYLRSVAK